MRPVRRGPSPQSTPFDKFQDAKPALVAGLGMYCSYCERYIPTCLAVEHLDAKSAHPGKAGDWDNFLLSCANCNSTKLTKPVHPDDLLLPDRDNTFAGFQYTPDGLVSPAPNLPPAIRPLAEATLQMVGLSKQLIATDDPNNLTRVFDRTAQRLSAWEQVERVRAHGQAHSESTLDYAKILGFFSVWMTVFAADPAMRNRLIDAFPGTRESGCFDPTTTEPISPAPNPDDLPGGGKI